MAAQPGHPSRFHDQGTADNFSANEKFHGKEPNGARILHLIQQFRLRSDGSRCLEFTTSCRQCSLVMYISRLIPSDHYCRHGPFNFVVDRLKRSCIGSISTFYS